MGAISKSRTAALLAYSLLSSAFVLLAYLHHSPPQPAPQAALGRFNFGRAWEGLVRFVGDSTPRASGSEGNAAARERLRSLIAETGATLEEQSFHARGWNRTAVPMTNLIASVPGSGSSSDAAQPVILIGAHYDCVPKGPGAGDNAAGVACALEILRDLKENPAACKVVVLFSDGEETGLNGARAFALDHYLWGSVAAVVNMDSRGSDGPVYIFETGSDGPWHTEILQRLDLPAHTTSLAAEAYRRMPNGTDFSVFLAGNKPGFNLAFIGSPRNYHTADDTVDALGRDSFNALGTTALALTRGLASRVGSHTHSARSHVWFDFFGFGVVAWPIWAGWAMTAGAMCVLCLAAAANRRQQCASFLGVVRCTLVGFAGLVAAAVAGTAAIELLKALGLLAFPWPTSGAWWGDALLLLLGGIAAALPSRWLWRRRTMRRSIEMVSWDSFFGGWAASGMLAIMVMALAPGASHPFTVPLAVAALASAAAVLGKFSTPWLSAAIAGASAIAVWAPLEAAFVDAFGLWQGGFTALRGAIIVIAARPLLDAPRPT